MLYPRPYTSAPPSVTPRWKKTGSGADLAVDLDTVKDFINRPREDTFWDAEIESFIKVAQVEIEKACHLALTANTYLVTVPTFEDRIRLTHRRPFLDVTGIQYVDAETGVIKDVDSDVFHAIPIDQECGMVFLGDGKAWPNAAYRWDAVRITVRAGFAIDQTDEAAGYMPMPEEVNHALLMTIASLDMARGDTQASPGSNVTVYAMKNSKGGGIMPVEAKALLRDWTYHWVTV